MFLFENSLIGAYWNRLYDFEERHSPFSVMAKLKKTVQLMNVMSQI